MTCTGCAAPDINNIIENTLYTEENVMTRAKNDII